MFRDGAITNNFNPHSNRIDGVISLYLRMQRVNNSELPEDLDFRIKAFLAERIPSLHYHQYLDAIDIKLSLVAELFTTPEEKILLRVLGIMPDHPAFQDARFLNILKGHVEDSALPLKLRMLFAKLTSKLKELVGIP